MCPKLCVRYETTSSQPIANCGKSAKTRPLPWSASLAQALAGLWQDSFRATAGAVASFCCSCSCTVSAPWQKGCSSPAPRNHGDYASPWQGHSVPGCSFSTTVTLLLMCCQWFWRTESVLDWMWLACKGLTPLQVSGSHFEHPSFYKMALTWGRSKLPLESHGRRERKRKVYKKLASLLNFCTKTDKLHFLHGMC